MEDLTKKLLLIAGIISVVIVMCIIGTIVYYVSTNNTLVQQDTAVEKSIGDLQTQYQRRADLIPNLVKVVEASAKFEKSTQTEVAGLRSQALSGQQMMKDAKTVEDIRAANNVIDNTLSRLMVVVEAYPQLKSTEAFQNLMTDIEGQENRIEYARNNYNGKVEAYRNTCRQIPSSFVAGMAGFNSDKWSMYQAKTGTDVAPTVSMNI